jgi:hypothetical protein
MSLHKLTAGSGYDYLTRQVAALDATDKGRTWLASYYAERGESPGVWVGSGMEGIDGGLVGDGEDAALRCWRRRRGDACGQRVGCSFTPPHDGSLVTATMVLRAVSRRSNSAVVSPVALETPPSRRLPASMSRAARCASGAR